MQNPWINLPSSPPYILKTDADLITAFNARAKAEVKIDLALYPEPYFGSLDAPVVVLNLNPGWDPNDAEVHQRKDFAAMALDSLQHKLEPYPFLHIQRSISWPGAQWWHQRVKPLIQDVGLERVALGLACVQFFPYHSKEYSKSCPTLPSQRYSFSLVRQAMERGAEIIVMRSLKEWSQAIPELKSYDRLHVGTNPRAPYISPGNLKSSYPQIVRRLKEAKF